MNTPRKKPLIGSFSEVVSNVFFGNSSPQDLDKEASKKLVIENASESEDDLSGKARNKSFNDDETDGGSFSMKVSTQTSSRNGSTLLAAFSSPERTLKTVEQVTTPKGWSAVKEAGSQTLVDDDRSSNSASGHWNSESLHDNTNLSSFLNITENPELEDDDADGTQRSESLIYNDLMFPEQSFNVDREQLSLTLDLSKIQQTPVNGDGTWHSVPSLGENNDTSLPNNSPIELIKKSNATSGYIRVGNVKSTQIFLQKDFDGNVFEDTPAHPIITPYSPIGISFPLAFQCDQFDDLPFALKGFGGYTCDYFFSAQNRPVGEQAVGAPPLLLRAHTYVHADATISKSRVGSYDVAVKSEDPNVQFKIKKSQPENYLQGQEVHTHANGDGLTASPNNLELTNLKVDETRVIWTMVVDKVKKRIAITQHWILSNTDHAALKAQLHLLGEGEVSQSTLSLSLRNHQNPRIQQLGESVHRLSLLNTGSVTPSSNSVSTVSTQNDESAIIDLILKVLSEKTNDSPKAPFIWEDAYKRTATKKSDRKDRERLEANTVKALRAIKQKCDAKSSLSIEEQWLLVTALTDYDDRLSHSKKLCASPFYQAIIDFAKEEGKEPKALRAELYSQEIFTLILSSNEAQNAREEDLYDKILERLPRLNNTQPGITVKSSASIFMTHNEKELTEKEIAQIFRFFDAQFYGLPKEDAAEKTRYLALLNRAFDKMNKLLLAEEKAKSRWYFFSSPPEASRPDRFLQYITPTPGLPAYTFAKFCKLQSDSWKGILPAHVDTFIRKHIQCLYVPNLPYELNDETPSLQDCIAPLLDEDSNQGPTRNKTVIEMIYHPGSKLDAELTRLENRLSNGSWIFGTTNARGREINEGTLKTKDRNEYETLSKLPFHRLELSSRIKMIFIRENKLKGDLENSGSSPAALIG